jgi:hypothetical protein
VQRARNAWQAYISISGWCWQPSALPLSASDDEAKSIWLRFLPESRVLPFGNKENFWEMGDQVRRGRAGALFKIEPSMCPSSCHGRLLPQHMSMGFALSLVTCITCSAVHHMHCGVLIAGCGF